MSTFEIVVFALVVDGANLVGIEICVVLVVRNGGLVAPRSFPELVEDSEILIGLQISLVVLDWRVDAYGFEGCFLPTGDNVPTVQRERYKSATYYGFTIVLERSD